MIPKAPLWKRLRGHSYKLIAAGIIVIAMGLRLFLLFSQWPLTHSDESTIDLMARDIAYKGTHPVFFYGQSYMGSIEAYLGAFLFRVVGGPSVEAVRVGLTLLFGLFLIVLYALTCKLYSQKHAVITLALLAFGSSTMLARQLTALGGYQEILICAPLLLLMAIWLCLNQPDPQVPRRRRMLVFGCWGLTAGIALWSDMLIFPFVLTSTLLLIIFCRREIRSFAPLAILTGLLLGLTPMIASILAYPGGPQAGFVQAFNATGAGGGLTSINISASIQATIRMSLPLATGGGLFCNRSTLIPDGQQDPIYSCDPFQIGWAVGYLLLMGISSGISLAALQYTRRQIHDPLKRHRLMIMYTAQILLLASGWITLLLYSIAPSAYTGPIISARYLNNLLVLTPALLAPLIGGHIWQEETMFSQRQRIRKVIRSGLLLGIAAIYLLGTIQTIRYIPTEQAQARQREEIGRILVRRGITHIYTDYWTCNRVAFQTQERVVCAVYYRYQDRIVLSPHDNRVHEFIQPVLKDPYAPYVFPTILDEVKYLKSLPDFRRRFTIENLPSIGYTIITPKYPQ